MARNSESSAARERILDKAESLFYKQGYQATGINQIIDECDVAKATFYSHFPSKEDLCMAYLKRVGEKENALVRDMLAKRQSPLARYMTVIDVLEPWLLQTEFRGCPFLNIASEIADQEHPIREIGVEFYQQQQKIIEQLVRDLKKSDPDKYSHLSPQIVAQRYITIFIGVIGMCEVLHSIEPLKDAVRMVRQLVEG